MKTTAKKVTNLTSKEVLKAIKKTKTTLVSYSMRMVIPTANYANIQPEIVVKSTSIEEAHDFIAPHMNKLWKEYYMISERRVEAKPIVPTVEAAPVSSVAFIKASQAITSCLSMEALELIKTQIEKSMKLTADDKPALLKSLALRAQELTKK
jgi:hypothetical protein